MKVPDTEKVVYTYYGKPEMSSGDIKEFFECSGRIATELKKKVQNYMAANNIPSWSPSTVSTSIAFKVWGLNIEEYEERLKKLKQLKLI